MMKKLCILFVLLFLDAVLFADNIDYKISSAVLNMENSVSGNMVIAVGNIVFSDNELGSEFSNLIKQKLKIALQKTIKFELSDTDNLDLIKEQWDFQHSGFVDENDAVRIGELAAVEALLLGTYIESGSNVNVYLNLTDVENGKIIYAQELVIPKSDISVSLYPSNYNSALNIINEVSDITNNNDALVNAWIEKGNGAVYEDGENLVVNFYSETGCYIKVFHIDVNGNTQLIFPNKYYSNNYIKADTVYSIPDSRYPFKFSLGEPFGTEFIKVIASNVQFDDIEESFSNLGTVTRGLLERGLNIEQNEKVSEMLLNYTIVP